MESVEIELIEALRQIPCRVQTRGDLQGLLSDIVDEARRLLGAEAASLFLYDEVEGDLRFEIVRGGDVGVERLHVPLSRGFVGEAARERRPVIVGDASIDPRHHRVAGRYAPRSVLAVPMVREERLVGVLEVLDRRPGLFGGREAQILEVLAQQAAVQIELTHLLSARFQMERLSAVGEGVANLAHTIKNLVHQLKGSSDLVELALERGDLELARRSWPLLRRENERLGALVAAILSFSSPVQVVPRELDLDALVVAVLAACRPLAEATGVRLEGPAPTGLLPVLDHDLLHEALLNLVMNAVEAQPAGGEVVVRAAAEGDDLVLAVQDRGQGVPAHLRERVFDPFFTTRGRRGTGLGLPQVVRAVREQGGEVVLDEAPGGGARFTLRFARSLARGAAARRLG